MVTFFPNLRVLDVEMEKVTEEFFESSMKSLMPGLNGKRRKLALYVYDNLITSSVKYAGKFKFLLFHSEIMKGNLRIIFVFYEKWIKVKGSNKMKCF